MKKRKKRKIFWHTTRYGRPSKYSTKSWRYNGKLIRL